MILDVRHHPANRMPALLLVASLSLVIFAGITNIANADVPTILQVDNISLDSTGKIRLQIRHANPSTNHYVDIIEVDINGQVTRFNRQPESGTPFTVELELGQLQGSPTVRVRANCNLHGWSPWSGNISIPEFTQIGLTLITTLAASVFVLRRTRKKRIVTCA